MGNSVEDFTAEAQRLREFLESHVYRERKVKQLLEERQKLQARLLAIEEELT